MEGVFKKARIVMLQMCVIHLSSVPLIIHGLADIRKCAIHVTNAGVGLLILW